MDNKNMVALNEEELEKVDGGFFFAALLAITGIAAALGTTVSGVKAIIRACK